MVKHIDVNNNELHVIDVKVGKYNYYVHIQMGRVAVIADKTAFDTNQFDANIKYIDVE